MEKIKSAVEAAKRQAGKKHKEDLESPPKGKKEVSSKPLDITYEYTRIIPLNDTLLEQNRIVSFDKNNQLSIGFDILRTQILSKMKEKGWRTMAITSPVPACGKTLVSINLAMSIAHNTDTTSMLVDFDLRRPNVAKTLGIDVSPSLNEVLNDEAKIPDALINPGIDRLVILPTANTMLHSSEILSSQKVKSLIRQLRDRYEERIVMFDLPPVLSSDDTITVLSEVDCVLLVIGNGMVSKEDLKETMRHIPEDKLIGTVLNKSESKKQNSYYY